MPVYQYLILLKHDYERTHHLRFEKSVITLSACSLLGGWKLSINLHLPCRVIYQPVGRKLWNSFKDVFNYETYFVTVIATSAACIRRQPPNILARVEMLAWFEPSLQLQTNQNSLFHFWLAFSSQFASVRRRLLLPSYRDGIDSMDHTARRPNF